MKDITAFCMKCKGKKVVKDPEQITHSNGKAAVTGKCSTCGTKVFRMGKLEGAKAADTKAETTAAKTSKTKAKKKISVS